MAETTQQCDTMLGVRVTRQDATLVKAAAAFHGQTVSGFLRAMVVPQVRRQLAAVVGGTPEPEGAGRG